MIKCKNAYIMLILMAIFGCSNGSKTSIVLDSTGKHPAGWAVALIGGLHPAAYQANKNACIECHGSAQDKNSNGGTSGASCFSASRNGIACHPNGPSSHPTGWSAAGSHGSAAKAAAPGLGYCTQCHGTNYTGGAGKSCMSCHTTAPHPIAVNWRAAVGSTGRTHTTTDPSNAQLCANCHNATAPNLAAPNLARFANSPAGSFKGATPDCFNASMCHGDIRKTSACDACHSTATTIPFKSMAGVTATSDAKVGAHVKHLNASLQTPAYSSSIACAECHTVPGTPSVSGTHRNGTNDISFGALAKTGSLVPTYTVATGVCANTYCHGTTLTGGGYNKSPDWNQSNYLVAGCATCHGYPPTTVRNGAAAHSSSSSCSGCHSNVNAANNGFSDPSKHINGNIETSGGASHGFPNPGSAHRTATPGTCQGCHNISSTTGSYPVSGSTAPNCAGCHKLALFAGCSDCHGDAATGRPNGTSFPNYNGRHSKHSGTACSVCHFNAGTGTSTHGNSGGVLKTANNVVVTFSSAGGTMSVTRSYNAATNRLSVTCTGNCHEQHSARNW